MLIPQLVLGCTDKGSSANSDAALASEGDGRNNDGGLGDETNALENMSAGAIALPAGLDDLGLAVTRVPKTGGTLSGPESNARLSGVSVRITSQSDEGDVLLEEGAPLNENVGRDLAIPNNGQAVAVSAVVAVVPQQNINAGALAITLPVSSSASLALTGNDSVAPKSRSLFTFSLSA